MAIEVAWINERQEPKQEVFDAHNVLSSLAMSRWPKLTKSVCLRFIDPWGDSVFNQAQVPELLAELRAEVAEHTDPKIRAHLEKVVRLVERAVEQTHTYIKFIGD